MSIITGEWLKKFPPQTGAIGKRQAAALNVPWENGWASKLICMPMTDRQQSDYESLCLADRSRRQRKQSKSRPFFRRHRHKKNKSLKKDHLHNILRTFWKRFGKLQTMQERLQLFIEMDGRIFKDESLPKPEDVRAAYERNRQELYHRLGGSCRCCRGSQREVLHHIIAIHHGGNNQTHNLIQLCHTCHHLIHPWLTQ